MRKLVLIAAILSASIVSPAKAATSDIRMDVTATVVANCKLIVPPLSFGTYDPLAVHAEQPADASVTMSVICTRNTTASVSFDLGLHPSSGAERGMNGPSAEVLHYQIYRDAARSQIWMNGTEAMRLLTNGVTSPNMLTVFGRIAPRQEVAPGAYTDVLTATVDF